MYRDHFVFVAIIRRGDTLRILIRGQRVQGYAISEVPDHLTIRLAAVDVPVESSVDRSPLQQFMDVLNRNGVQAEFKQGNYLCSFGARMLQLWPDRSCPDGSFIMQLSVPARVRRVYQPDDRS